MNLCPTCLGAGFIYSAGGYAPKLPCPTCEDDDRPLLIPAFTVMERKPVFPETTPHEEPNGWPEKE